MINDNGFFVYETKVLRPRSLKNYIIISPDHFQQCKNQTESAANSVPHSILWQSAVVDTGRPIRWTSKLWCAAFQSFVRINTGRCVKHFTIFSNENIDSHLARNQGQENRHSVHVAIARFRRDAGNPPKYSVEKAYLQ